jgi:putative drug exporter of the RND superfamily
MLEGLARICYTRRWRIVFAWIGLLIGLTMLGNAFKVKSSNNFSIPGTESQRAIDLLKTRFPARGGESGDLVFKADGGITNPAAKADIQQLLGQVAAMPKVAGVDDPYGPGGGRLVSKDGTIAYAEVRFVGHIGNVSKTTADQLITLANQANRPGLEVELGGELFTRPHPPGSTEGVGLLAAVVILLISFGSLLAMGLPILTAIFGIGCGLALVALLTNLLDVPDFTDQLAAMIGIGVGIDYALFIVTRHRHALHEGKTPEEATVEAITTSGRAVLFAGCTVVISLLGMMLMGVAFVRGLALGAVAAVLMTMLASVTLLPAILGFAGSHIESKRARRRAERGESTKSIWYRWSRFIQRYPWPAAIGGLIALLAFASPMLSIRLGSADAGNNPTSDTTRRAYDLLSEGFGPGFNGPLLLAAELPGPQTMPVLQRVAQEIAKQPGVAFVTPPFPNPAGDAAVLQVLPTTSPQDTRTEALIKRLRADAVPKATAGTGVRISVGGQTAAFDDLSSKLSHRLPLFIGAVIALSFLLLMVVFRSLLVPVKAAVMNLLSIGSAYGVVVAVFQWGWGKGLLGLGKTGPIEAFLPMMLFAILFGLSMDYEVFLLSRIREEYVRTGDNGLAVADGLAATARVITAAAALMVCVFLSFVFGDNRVIKLFGLGLSSAIFIDATLVRMVLVPATMELLGDANWWLPRWLDRLLPTVRVESHADVEVVTPEPELLRVRDEEVPAGTPGGG